MPTTFTNFGRNVSFRPAEVFRPHSADELLAILEQHPDRSFRAIGSLHAWSRAAEADDVLIDTSRLDSVRLADDGQSVVVGGGCKVKQLLAVLKRWGKTLPSVGLIDEQSVAGASATGTHGSGRHSLSHYIRSLSIAHFSSSRPTITRIDGGDELLAGRCSLGLLGIVVEIEFECRAQYNVLECARMHNSLESVLGCEQEFPLQQFYLMPWSWKFFAHHRVETRQPRSRLAGLYRAYCFTVIDIGLHVAIVSLVKLLKVPFLVRAFYRWILPLTIVRNWRVVDDSHRMLVMEHELFRHVEIELFVRRKDLSDAMGLLIDVLRVFGGAAIENVSTQTRMESISRWQEFVGCRSIHQHHYPICVRRVEADDTLISASCADDPVHPGMVPTDWYAISLISYQRPGDRDGFMQFANFIAPVMAELFGGRCHWGKINPLDRNASEQLHVRLNRFRAIVRNFDPHGQFSNQWLDDVILARPSEFRQSSHQA